MSQRQAVAKTIAARYKHVCKAEKGRIQDELLRDDGLAPQSRA